ncbi:alpha-glucosidase [Pontivivens insulae]|uniref:Oligo-1,6-glucosidase 1 n=1 Tax=Pontivivens insulae TaxID=1639689 RepID=A0A2R8AD24_9RHOB|nr:alpha-glucosidase [Pontivivens insulae]RED14073.1 alpha-glucosidase [Pontivivens insulae]SPF30147.1 Oligo-1,6-glucosidase 1 [Pontivivens insulae]
MTNPDWWRGATFYQIYPRSYQDSTGDGIGDFKGITRRLDHIASLGVDAIWISPFNKSPMKDFGYDVSDYSDVDPMFGTMDDFDALIARAHELGLKVTMDMVMSHCSDQHEWFKESRQSRDNAKADWFVWADAKEDGSAPTNWLSVFGGPSWEWDSVRRQYYLHNFLASQPDLNYHNPDVQDAMLGEVRFWLDRGIDGFRFDACNYHFHDQQLRDNPPAARSTGSSFIEASNPYSFQQHDFDKSRPENLGFLKRVRDLLNEYEGRTSVGEVGDEARSYDTVAAYTRGGERLHMAYTFDLLADQFSADFIRKTVERIEDKVSEGWVCHSFSNHDVTRHVTRWADNGAREPLAKFCITLLTALRGTICLYQGEELALPEADIAYEDLTDPYGIRFWPGFKGRDGCRTPMVWEGDEPFGGFSNTNAAKPWLPVPSEHLALAVDQQGEGSVLDHYRAAITHRQTDPVALKGSIAFQDAPDGVLTFVRAHEGQSQLYVFNFTQVEQEITVTPGQVVPFPTACGQVGTLDGNRLSLPPLGFAYIRP